MNGKYYKTAVRPGVLPRKDAESRVLNKKVKKMDVENCVCAVAEWWTGFTTEYCIYYTTNYRVFTSETGTEPGKTRENRLGWFERRCVGGRNNDDDEMVK